MERREVKKPRIWEWNLVEVELPNIIWLEQTGELAFWRINNLSCYLEEEVERTSQNEQRDLEFKTDSRSSMDLFGQEVAQQATSGLNHLTVMKL